MRPRHNLQTAIGDGGVVDGDVGCEVCDGRDVAVGVVVDVSVEAVAVGEFVVDFVFEEGCFLFSFLVFFPPLIIEMEKKEEENKGKMYTSPANCARIPPKSSPQTRSLNGAWKSTKCSVRISWRVPSDVTSK